jgi:hypothetical protein
MAVGEIQTIFLHLNFSGREDVEYTNPNEVTLLLLIFLCSIDECIKIHFLDINFERAHHVRCGKPMPLE